MQGAQISKEVMGSHLLLYIIMSDDLLIVGALLLVLLFSLQYYLKTGTCKFGSNCKYHHPKQDGSVQSVILNNNGFPLRPV